MPTADAPRAATWADAALASRVLARAFDDDPMMRWFFPGDEARAAGLGRYFGTLFTGHYLRHGVCERTAAAVAFWAGPQAPGVPDAETVGALTDVLGERAGLFRDAVETAARHAPREPHWYLAVIGADPEARGQGQGAALLRSGLARADAAGLPVYLESSKPENLPFYERFGFRVGAEVRLPGGGPVLWAMRRAAGA
jgi:ribosomal protein S18 acetylase RimI-like enzyme